MLRVLMALAVAAMLLLPQAPALAQPAVTITVDRGSAATYTVGEPVTIRYTVPQSTFIRILSTAVNGTTVLAEGNVQGAGELPTTATLPLGQRTLTLQTYTNSKDIGATAQTAYSVVPTTNAAAPRALSCGTFAGNLNNPTDVEAWTFAGQAGQQIALRVDAAPSVPVRLISPTGALLGTGTNGVSATLSTTGDFRVEVGGGAITAGSAPAIPYSISLDCLAAGYGPLPSAPASDVLLTCGGTINAQLPGITDAQTWNLQAPAGQQVTISARAGTPLPIRIYDATGALLTAGSTEVRNFMFPADGVYQVTVGNGTTANAPAPLDYSISVGCAAPAAVIVPANLPCNSVTSAQLANLNDADRWNFAGVQGHTANVQVTSATPLPVRIIDPNGAIAGQGTGSAKALITGQTGLYTVVVGGVETPDPGQPINYTIGIQCGS